MNRNIVLKDINNKTSTNMEPCVTPDNNWSNLLKVLLLLTDVFRFFR